MAFSTLRLLLLAGFVISALAQHGGGGHGEDGPTPADLKNVDFTKWLSWTWAVLAAFFIGFRLTIYLVNHIRHLACLTNDKQTYFATPDSLYGKLKRWFIVAPLWRTRHHREFRLSQAINIGTLPSRFQTFFLSGYVATNTAFCVLSIDWSGEYETVARELRNRTGVLAVVNMIPLFLLAGRNNPLINLTGLSFDTYNLIHRWIGRIVVLEAVCHTLAWMIPKVHTKGWAAVSGSVNHSNFIMSGTIGVVAFVFLLLQSPSVLRHAFYETFLHGHILGAALAVGAVWVHLKDRPQRSFLVAVIAIWVIERTLRLGMIVYRNVGSGGTKADVEVLPGDALRITLRVARPWRFRPGQHVYLYIPSIGWWTSHPFSLIWSEEEMPVEEVAGDIEKGFIPPSTMTTNVASSALEPHKTTMSLIVRRRTGFTDKLFRAADAKIGGKLTTTALVEGPYGHDESLQTYGTAMLFATGVGITHQVPHVRGLLRGYANGTVATRKVVLVWIIQAPEHLEWIRPWMMSILAMPHRRQALKVLLFVTRPRSTKEIHSPSASVQMYPGKPNVEALVDQEIESQVGAMAVSVCGTGGLADDVRRAARRRMTTSNIDFVEEAFSW
ncbi:ferric reductase like transmembrane component-domain-containing protein [Lineolata rhizophorae]|uniref:ferric-chelate reductase (NADPH) n=1 Tax=Lineolata rhizophorae TaxID=578093 RepID=A0A6A6NWB9_9PEZI|nr:ferric reductase like transmembrane component-domain-containing protein [Lineolata rhizophorae]